MTLAVLLPRIASGAFNTELWNGLVGLAGESLPLGDGGAALRYTLASPPAADAWLATLQLTGGGITYVHVRDFPFRQMFNIGLDAADVAALPDGLRQAMLDGMFASILGALPQQARDAVSIGAQGLAPAFPDHAASHVQWFDVALQRPDGSSVAFDVGCDRTALLRLLGGSLTSYAPANGPLAERVALSAYPTLGRVALGYDEFRKLEPGAMVVLPQRPAGQLAVRVDTVTYEFSQTDDGWACLGGHPALIDGPQGALMDDTNDPAGGPESKPEAVSVSGLRIALDFDIARLSVPVSTLSQWQAGSVVPIDVPDTGDGLEVTIRADGDVIGQGDLVRIDDRLAVRITRLLVRS